MLKLSYLIASNASLRPKNTANPDEELTKYHERIKLKTVIITGASVSEYLHAYISWMSKFGSFIPRSHTSLIIRTVRLDSNRAKVVVADMNLSSA